MSPRILLLFLDGVGLGSDDPARNPLVAAELPVLNGLVSGPLTASRAGAASDRATLVPLDATLDVAGLPQSGTGQVALLTGTNAAEAFGRHYGPWVPTALRPVLAAENVLRRAQEAGCRVAFANAYPEEVLARYAEQGGALRGATPLRAAMPYAALTAGLLDRHTPALQAGSAVASEIVNDGWIERLRRVELPRVSAEEAGGNLARIAAAHDLTLFAHYATDHVGHRGDMAAAVGAIERVDRFVGGLLHTLPADVVLLVASDHGNLEEVGAGHTRNPALGLVVGPGHAALAAALTSIMDVAPLVLRQLVCGRQEGRRGEPE